VGGKAVPEGVEPSEEDHRAEELTMWKRSSGGGRARDKEDRWGSHEEDKAWGRTLTLLHVRAALSPNVSLDAPLP
jgi:hypothetical protein